MSAGGVPRERGPDRMIFGAHVILMSNDPAADRAFLRDVLDLPWVEDHTVEGGGWLLFRLPPAELAVHPGGDERAHGGAALAGAVVYLMCDDLDETTTTLAARAVACDPAERQPWGRATRFSLPSGARLGLYEPFHPLALEATSRTG